MAVERKDFGQLSDGSRVSLYTITNARGESVSLTDYGASVVSLLVHDRQGALRDIVLGCDDAPAYERQTACLGGVPGRHANRIARDGLCSTARPISWQSTMERTTCMGDRPASIAACGGQQWGRTA